MKGKTIGETLLKCKDNNEKNSIENLSPPYDNVHLLYRTYLVCWWLKYPGVVDHIWASILSSMLLCRLRYYSRLQYLQLTTNKGKMPIRYMSQQTRTKPTIGNVAYAMASLNLPCYELLHSKLMGEAMKYMTYVTVLSLAEILPGIMTDGR